MANSVSKADLFSGGVFIAFGAFFASQAATYDIGTPFRMGPGFMPLLLGIVLCLLGLVVVLVGLRKGKDEAISAPSWRGIVLVLGTLIFFALTLRGLGFIPVAFISAFATALASRLNSVLFAALLAAGLTALCVLVFVIGLGLQIPLIGPWLSF